MFRVMVVKKQKRGSYPIFLADYEAGERVNTFKLLTKGTRGEQMQFAEELSEFTGFDIEDEFGEVIHV